GLAEPLQPLQLVGVVRVVDLAAVGDVQAPHPHPAAHGAERAGLRLRRVAPAGLSGEADAHVVQPHPGGDRDPVPLRQPVVGDLVAEFGEDLGRELVVPALRLLEGDDVHVAPLQPGGDALAARPHTVHIPRRQSHTARLAPAARGTARPTGSGHLPGLPDLSVFPACTSLGLRNGRLYGWRRLESPQTTDSPQGPAPRGSDGGGMSTGAVGEACAHRPRVRPKAREVPGSASRTGANTMTETTEVFR